MADRPTIDVPALALTKADLILVDPDKNEPVVWQVDHRREERAPDGIKVVIDYYTPDGVEGAHVFDAADPVTVRLPRYPDVTEQAAA